MNLPSVLVMGAFGNMGTRYRTILRYLNIPYHEYDVGEFNLLKTKVKKSDMVMIATPTRDHTLHIDMVSSLKPGIPILCEKPIGTDHHIFDAFMKRAKENEYNLRMVNQYQYLLPKLSRVLGEYTEYNYYNSGKDGMIWDCINIIGLDRTGNISIKRDSPIWTCTINGHEIERGLMDQAYVNMVKDWIEDPTPNLPYIERAHRKVWELRTKSL